MIGPPSWSPSRAPDPSGRTALEAMASGAAVICFREGALPEVAGDAAVFTDPAESADTIRVLGADPPRLAALGEADGNGRWNSICRRSAG